MNRICSSLRPSSAPSCLSPRIFRNRSTIRHILAPTDLSNESRSKIKYAAGA